MSHGGEIKLDAFFTVTSPNSSVDDCSLLDDLTMFDPWDDLIMFKFCSESFVLRIRLTLSIYKF